MLKYGVQLSFFLQLNEDQNIFSDFFSLKRDKCKTLFSEYREKNEIPEIIVAPDMKNDNYLTSS